MLGLTFVQDYLKVRQSQNDFFKPMFLPKKRTKDFNFTTMIPQVDLFLFIFLEEIEDTKKSFQN